MHGQALRSFNTDSDNSPGSITVEESQRIHYHFRFEWVDVCMSMIRAEEALVELLGAKSRGAEHGGAKFHCSSSNAVLSSFAYLHRTAYRLS